MATNCRGQNESQLEWERGDSAEGESKDKTWQVLKQAEERWNCDPWRPRECHKEVRKDQVGMCWGKSRVRGNGSARPNSGYC